NDASINFSGIIRRQSVQSSASSCLNRNSTQKRRRRRSSSDCVENKWRYLVILSDGTQRWIDYKEAKREQEFQLIVDFELRCMRVFELLGNGYQILLNETYMILEQVKQYQKTLKRRKIDDCFKTTTTTTT